LPQGVLGTRLLLGVAGPGLEGPAAREGGRRRPGAGPGTGPVNLLSKHRSGRIAPAFSRLARPAPRPVQWILGNPPSKELTNAYIDVRPLPAPRPARAGFRPPADRSRPPGH